MTYDQSKQLSQRRYVEMLEIDLDINDPEFDDIFAAEPNSYGTPRTTQDSRAYKEGSIRTYRFANQMIPYDKHYYPKLGARHENSSLPAELKPGDQLALSASARITLNDFLDNDSYPLQGAYVNKRIRTPGSFFRRLIARNYIRNRPARFKRGYIPVGRMMTEDDFQVEHYVVKDITDPDSKGKVVVELIDRLFFASNDKAKIPITSNAVLTSEIDDSSATGSFNFLATTFGNKGINDAAPVVGDNTVLNIGNELFRGSVTAYNNTVGTFNFTERGLGGSEIQSHSSGDEIQGVVEYDNINVTDVLRHIFNNFTKSNPNNNFINDVSWDSLKAGDLAGVNLTNFLTQPINVKDAINQIIKSTGIWMYFDVILNQIEIGKTPRFANPALTLNSEILLRGGVTSKPDIRRQITRQVIRYAKIDYTEGDNIREYFKHFRTQNDILEDDDAYGQITEGPAILSNWYTASNNDVVQAQSIPALNVARFANIPRTYTVILDSAYIGNLPNGNRLWYGSTVAIESPSRVNLDDSPVVETGQVVSIRRQNDLDRWRVVILTYDSEGPPVENVDLTIDQSSNNVNIFNLFPTAPTESREYIIVISPGVVIGSVGISLPALTTGDGWPAGSTLLIYNFGQIIGAGGSGGNGGANNDDLGVVPPSSGQSGGDAFHLTVDTTIDNLQGLIGGGGAGGRGGFAPERNSGGGGGGGGAGRIAGSGGNANGDIPNAQDGNDGNDSFGGTGGAGVPSGIGENGKNGGSLGEGTFSVNGQPVPAGRAIVRNGNNVVILNGNNDNQIKGDIVNV